MPGDAARITTSVDASSYCAGIYESGNIGSSDANFSVRIIHP
jgi:hypothetical protein